MQGLLVLLNSGQPQVDESGTGDPAGVSMQQCPNSGNEARRNSQSFRLKAPTPGEANACVPRVESILAGTPTPTNDDAIVFTVTFSESVTGVDIDDFTLSCTGSASGAISRVSGSGSTWNVTVDSITGDGTLCLTLVDNGSIWGGENSLEAGDTSGHSHTIDNTHPVLNSFVRHQPQERLTNSDTLVFRATFSSDVRNIHTSDFSVKGTNPGQGYRPCGGYRCQCIRHYRIRRRPGRFYRIGGH